MARNHSFIIELPKRADRDDIREDLAKRPGKKDKLAKKQKPVIEVAKVPKKWKPISMKQSDLPIVINNLSESGEFSDDFLEAERDWYRSQGAMDNPQFWLFGDEYDDYNDFVAMLEKERV